MHQDFRNFRVENKQHAALDDKIKDQLRDLPSAGKDALDDHHDASDLKPRIRSLAALDFCLILPNVGIHIGLKQSNMLPAMKVLPC
jgi:hypothetical protein